MKNVLAAIVALILAPGLSEAAAAQHGPLGHYTARLSARDHFNSNGERLRTVAAIIRQDRANVHRFGRADVEDQLDSFFANAANRAALERLIAHGRVSQAVQQIIVDKEPLVHVDIYAGYVVITLYR